MRPPLSVVITALDDGADPSSALEALADAVDGRRDEVIIVTGRDKEVAAGALDASIIAARDGHSPYYAYNVGAAAATRDWILFLDAGARLETQALDAHFAGGTDDRRGASIGEVRGAKRRRGVPAQASNILVRREAWRSVGGFHEGIRAGGETDFCLRLERGGWRIDDRPGAVARDPRFDRAAPLLSAMLREGAGSAWLRRRYPRERPRGRAGKRGAVARVAEALGRLQSNAAETAVPRRAQGADVVIVRASFPELSETFVVEEARALARLGLAVRVEAVARPARPALGAAREFEVNYREDDSLLARLRCLAWVVGRHPIASMRERRAAARWRARGEHVSRLGSIAVPARRLGRLGGRHLHAHFARGESLDALRLHMLTRVPHSVTAHGTYDIWSNPPNLEEKLRRASFVTTGSEYNLRHLRAVVGPGDADRVHKIVMGVDGERVVRTEPPPGGRIVIGVGRLIETKGFADLIEAIALLERSDAVELLRIVGDGPLRDELSRQARDLGVERRVDFTGAREPEEVLRLVERADLLAMPCIVTGDGLRDSMPVAVKEAMALELPVVGTNEVGLPELIHDGWGRLVPPSDPTSLARAISELLALPVADRTAMGAAARAFVLEHCNVDRESAKLARLMGLA